MNDGKSKSPLPAASRRPAQAPAPLSRPHQTQNQRWQRSVRFNWDKGGSKGGRK